MAFGPWADGVWVEEIWEPGLWGEDPPGTPEVPTVSINQGSTMELEVGARRRLTATYTGEPEPTLAWDSDNDLIATVDANGRVTAVSVGTCNITVTATNTEGFDTDAIIVTIVAASPETWTKKGLLLFSRRR